ncbi:glycosyltransferase family 2 protein [Vibrio parahaemolyticus]|nr:glycosyltransferase family 2 protein [Vibrio parahaemolyticus]
MNSVSVVIPVYNGEFVVKNAINSALAQEEVLEVICINDGSTDKSLAVLDSINNPRVKVFSIKNSGASYARNFGAMKAKSNYIAFLDADDYYLQNRFCKQLPIMVDNKKKLSISSVLVTSMDNDFIYNFSKSKFSSLSAGNKIKAIFGQFLTMNTPTIIVEKDFFFSLGGFDTTLSLREDHKFIIEALRVEDIHIESTSPVVRRQYLSSTTSSVSIEELISGNEIFQCSLSTVSNIEKMLSEMSLFHVCFRRFGLVKSLNYKRSWLKYLFFYPFYLLARVYLK